ncbi:DUF3037 domain-containing protein [Undibacterium sp. Di27W]|uniref:DUF3037 domain-containing protein n=1 Tax=Undibacterium sp. Di27W TaxID=3413036 RepID=UPI003BF31B89
MINIAKYCVIQLLPNPERHEVINVGLLIWNHNAWDIQMLPDERKLHALNPRYPANGLASVALTIKEITKGLNTFEQCQQALNRIGRGCFLHNYIGQFSAETDKKYASEVTWLIDDLIMPPSTPTFTEKNKIPQSRLKTKLRRKFQEMNWLSKKLADIHNHKIIEKFPIAANQGLYAEFAIKNGAIHVTETIDFDVSESSKKQKEIEAQAKTLILSAARKHLGGDTRTYVVVSGSQRLAAGNSINLLKDHNAEVFSLEQPSEMNIYYQKILSAINS